MKKMSVLILLVLISAAMLFGSGAFSYANYETSIEDLVMNPEVHNRRQVTLQGFLVVEQPFGKSIEFSLRDSHGKSAVALKFSKGTDVSKYAGKRMEMTGVFEVHGRETQLMVSSVTPLEEASPESDLVTGAQNTLVIMAYFTDRVNTKSYGDVYRMIFNDVNGYYMEASYDQLYITGSWSPWVQVGHTVAYYGQTNPSWWFIRDAVAAVDSGVNFAGYSRLVFVNAGPNEETSGAATDIWSVRWSGLSIATNDGVTITHGAIVPDIEAGSYGVLGVQSHEYGHELGLPDLYGYANGVGAWDGMAEGTWNNAGNTPASFTSYTRNLAGWIAASKIRTISSGTAELLMLDPLEDATATISVIRLNSGSNYYLIEARRKVGSDTYLPNERVLVLYYEAATGRLYLRAALAAGNSYRSGNVEVLVTKQDMENWSFQVYVSYKSWISDKRLTSNGSSSNTNWRGSAVASAGSYVYVVWDETRDGNWEIYFKRSTNYGSTWGADTRLTSNTASSWYPSVAAYGSYVYIVWQDYRDGNWEVYCLRSENYGASWYPAVRLSANSADSLFPSVAAYARNVYVAWHDNRDGHYEIYRRRSLDNGLNWLAEARLSTLDAFNSQQARVAAYRGYVYVVWEDARNGGWDIYIKRSADYGVSWGSDTRLTTNAADQREPSVAAYGYDVHVVWTDYRNANNSEIYYRRSINSGTSYLTEVRLTSYTGTSTQASVAVTGKTVYVVWVDTRTGTWEIFFKDSPDRGVHWTADRILSAQPNASFWPSISLAGDNVYVAWTDERDGNQEIYFKYRW